MQDIKHIKINQSTFERLQQHAEPFVDTIDTVINRALDTLDEKNNEPKSPPTEAAEEIHIDWRALPDLTHTRVLAATMDQKPINNPNWNRVLDQVLILAMDQHRDFSALCTLCPINMVRGRKKDKGFRYLTEINVSVQGQNANVVCNTIVAAIRGLGLALDISFEWHNKEGAAHPGKRARLPVPAKSK